MSRNFGLLMQKKQSVGAQVWQKTIQSMWNQATAAKKAQLDANTVALDDCWDPRCNGVPEGEPTGNVEITRIDWENRIEWGYTGKNMGIRTFAHCYQFWPSRCFLLIATRRHSAMKSQDHFCSWIAETCTCLDKSTHTYLSIYIYIHIIYENKYTYM